MNITQQTLTRFAGTQATTALVQRALQLLPGGGRSSAADVAEITNIVRMLLSEPTPVARRIAIASLATNRAFYTCNDWLAGLPEPEVLAYVNRLQCPQQRQLRAVASSGQPLLLITSHSGNYLPVMMRVTAMLPAGMPLTVIKREAPNRRDRLIDIMRQQRPITISRTSANAARTGLRALRRGEALIMMADVPPAMQTQSDQGCWDCELLGRPGRLPRGPAVLAARTDALIVPVQQYGNTIELGPALDARRFPPTNRAQALHHAIARHVSQWIRTNPSNWMLWRLAPSFFPAESSG